MENVTKELAEFLFETYGHPAQLGTASEEMAEFIQASIKWLFRSNKDENFEKIHEEYADVLIMMEQLKYWLDPDLIATYKIYKLNRLEGRLEEKGFDVEKLFIEKPQSLDISFCGDCDYAGTGRCDGCRRASLEILLDNEELVDKHSYYKNDE